MRKIVYGEWFDITPYKPGEPRIPRAWRYKAGCVNITVHKHTPNNGWWLTCVEADYVAHPLDTEDQEAAKAASLVLVRDKLSQALGELTKPPSADT